MAKKNNGSRIPRRTLGPVSDLERHLPTEWWKNLFGSVYLKTDGDVVENDRNTKHEVDRIINAVGLEPNDRILDLCCGQGRHSLELARRGFQQVVGVDRSRYLVRLARRRSREKGFKVSFHEGDARRFRQGESTFHCVTILGNSFGYFEREEEDLAVLKACRRALRPGGILVLDITDGDWMRMHFEPRSWEWIDEDQFVCRERSLSGDGLRLISREVVVHAEKGVIIDQFYAERLYNQEAILKLLEAGGFEAPRVHDSVKTHSDRGQDLGMMGRRLLVTSSTPRHIAAPSKKASRIKEVTVIMGDPRLPDTVKLGGVFNPEDFETIVRLKKSLEELSDFRFDFMDNHAGLMAKLRSDPPKLVFNLCDEGFNNEAFLELHVPAYLEMLGVPYTGAGPSCLGLCYNKSLVCAIASSLGIPIPLETYHNPDDQSATLPSTFPALVKPNYGDSSIGITKEAVVNTSEELIGYIDALRNTVPGRPLLIQEFLSGKEYSVGVIGNPRSTVNILPILEVDFSGLPEGLPEILGYESKWIPQSPYWTEVKCKEAKLKDEEYRFLQDSSIRLFEQLDCRDYARFDFRSDAQGQIKLLEVNPNPGWCWDGKLNYMAGFAGMRYSDLLGQILKAAVERISW